MMSATIYEYAQLSCIVETLAFGITLVFIGNSKVAETRWLKKVKWVVSIVFLLVGLTTALQWALDLNKLYPMVDMALNATVLCLVTYLLGVAFLPLASSSYQTSNRLIFSSLIVLGCIILLWVAALLFTPPLSYLLVFVSMAVYSIELSRVLIVFFYNYKQLKSLDLEAGSEDEMRLNCLNFIVRSFFLLALFAALYVFIVALPEAYRALHYLAMLLVWAFLFVSIVNLVINYNPLGDRYIHIVSDSSDTHPTVTFMPELAPKVDDWIENKGYLAPGLTLLQVAEQLSTNRTYLSQYINSNYGCNFNAWLAQLRIDESKHLLLSSPALSIDRIAYNAGFSSKAHFINTFKSCEGTTPGRWREKHC